MHACDYTNLQNRERERTSGVLFQQAPPVRVACPARSADLVNGFPTQDPRICSAGMRLPETPSLENPKLRPDWALVERESIQPLERVCRFKPFTKLLSVFHQGIV